MSKFFNSIFYESCLQCFPEIKHNLKQMSEFFVGIVYSSFFNFFKLCGFGLNIYPLAHNAMVVLHLKYSETLLCPCV